MVNKNIVVDENWTKEIGQRIKQCRKRTLISLQEMADHIYMLDELSEKTGGIIVTVDDGRL